MRLPSVEGGSEWAKGRPGLGVGGQRWWHTLPLHSKRPTESRRPTWPPQFCTCWTAVKDLSRPIAAGNILPRVRDQTFPYIEKTLEGAHSPMDIAAPIQHCCSSGRRWGLGLGCLLFYEVHSTVVWSGNASRFLECSNLTCAISGSTISYQLLGHPHPPPQFIIIGSSHTLHWKPRWMSDTCLYAKFLSFLNTFTFLNILKEFARAKSCEKTGVWWAALVNWKLPGMEFRADLQYGNINTKLKMDLSKNQWKEMKKKMKPGISYPSGKQLLNTTFKCFIWKISR